MTTLHRAQHRPPTMFWVPNVLGSIVRLFRTPPRKPNSAYRCAVGLLFDETVVKANIFVDCISDKCRMFLEFGIMLVTGSTPRDMPGVSGQFILGVYGTIGVLWVKLMVRLVHHLNTLTPGTIITITFAVIPHWGLVLWLNKCAPKYAILVSSVAHGSCCALCH